MLIKLNNHTFLNDRTVEKEIKVRSVFYEIDFASEKKKTLFFMPILKLKRKTLCKRAHYSNI